MELRYCSISSQEQGNALLIVMLAMVLLMGIAGGLTEHMAANESRAINESLARVQAYWAMRGMLDRAASRMGEDNKTATLPDAASIGLDDDIVGKLQDYIGTEADLNNITTNGQTVLSRITSSPILHRWYYPEMGAGYIFDVETNNTTKYPTADSPFGQDKRPSGGNPDTDNNNGRLFLLFTLSNPATNGTSPLPPVPLLEDIDLRLPSLKANLCVGNVVKASRTYAAGAFPSCIDTDLDPDPDAGIVTVEKLNLVWRGR